MEEERILTPKHEELVKRLCKLFPEAQIYIDECVPVMNCWGVQIAHGPGVVYRVVTQSYETGPESDWSSEIAEILCNCGFEKASFYSSGCDERNYENYHIHRYVESCSKVYEY